MKAQTWESAWLKKYCVDLPMENAWRGVETQYIAASLKLVDSLQEQQLLEQLLENSKPPIARDFAPKH